MRRRDRHLNPGLNSRCEGACQRSMRDRDEVPLEALNLPHAPYAPEVLAYSWAAVSGWKGRESGASREP